MAFYQLRSRTSSGAATNNPSWGLLTGASKQVKLLELKIVIGSATASEYSLGLAAAAGTQTSGVNPKALVLGGSDGTCTIATAWSANPTIPTAFIDGVTFPATIGSMVFWAFPDGGLLVPVNSELVLWNTSSGTNAAISMFTALIEEL